MDSSSEVSDNKVEIGMSEAKSEGGTTTPTVNGFENPWPSTVSAPPDLNVGQRFSVEQVAGTMEEGRSKSPEEQSSRFTPRKVSLDASLVEAKNEATVGYATIGYATNEAIPMTVFYRDDNSQSYKGKKHRPTLQELQKGFEDDNEQQGDEAEMENGLYQSGDNVTVRGDVKGKLAPKFGWLKGVMLRCLLNIWGVMLFLRLTWVVGQSGMIWSTVIILLSALVTTMTTLSMSAVCTNGEVKGGGAYFLISRSLGPEFGGSIGLIFSLANAVAVALYVVGFAETVRDILKENDALMIDEVNDVRIIGILCVLLLLSVTLIGLEWVVRTQMFLLGILLISIVDATVGTFISPLNPLAKAQGIVGVNMNSFKTNLLPDYRGSENFFSVFAVFFPAATGILAGINISGDLKNAQTAIPKGTLWAILWSTIVYIALAWFAGVCVLRDADGIVATVAGVNATLNATSALRPLCPGPDCPYGLINDYQVMEKMAAWGPLVTCGIFAATLSSALASLVGAPKTFQALCKDKIFPYITYFGVGTGPGEEPRRGYILTFIIAAAFIAVGDLNVIAPVISNFFLMSYALINYAVFAASLGRSPGWRPSFKYYNMWVSLLGALLCVAIMFLINWWAALVTIIIIASLHKYVDIKKPEVNWGSSSQAFTYIRALRFAYRLNTTEDHVKNFRPQCLVLTGPPSSRPNLTYIVSQITKNVGLMICGQVNVGKFYNTTGNENDWLRDRKIRAFHSICTASSLRSGVQSLLQAAGLGKLKPNTLVIGFKQNWMRAPRAEVDEYVHIINDAFELNCGVAILRVRDEFEIEDMEDGADWLDDDAEDDDLLQSGSMQAGSGSKESQSVRIASPDSIASEGSRTRGMRFFHVKRSETPESTSLMVEASSDGQDRDEEMCSVEDMGTQTIDDELTSETQGDSELLVGGGSLRQRGVSSVSGSTYADRIELDYPSGSTKVEIGSLSARERSATPDPSEVTSEVSGSVSVTTTSDRAKGFRVSLREVPEDEQTEQGKISPMQPSSVPSITFKGKQKGTVDVWWLFDDGGLTVLVPYLLSLHSSWKGCRLKIFTPESSDIKHKEIRMANLLKKFRIDVESVEVVRGIDKRPTKKSIEEFRRLPIREELEEGVHLDKRILRQIRIGELLRQHSMDARLIVMTLPVPKLGFITPLMYMSWLEVLSADLPPVMLIRGNQTSVLTFYC